MDDQKEPNGVTKGRVHMGVIRGVIFVKTGKSCNFFHLTATFRLNVICQKVTKIARTFLNIYSNSNPLELKPIEKSKMHVAMWIFSVAILNIK